MRKYANLSLSSGSLPEETTILNFRRLLETHDLASKLSAEVDAQFSAHEQLPKRRTIMDTTFVYTPSSTKNIDKTRDPEMRQTNKGQQYFGMKVHIGVDVEWPEATRPWLAHTVTTAAANVSDIVKVVELEHVEEKSGLADAGYIGADKREPKRSRTSDIAANRVAIRAMPESELTQATPLLGYLKNTVCTKVGHPSRGMARGYSFKRQFGYQMVRFRG